MGQQFLRVDEISKNINIEIHEGQVSKLIEELASPDELIRGSAESSLNNLVLRCAGEYRTSNVASPAGTVVVNTVNFPQEDRLQFRTELKRYRNKLEAVFLNGPQTAVFCSALCLALAEADGKFLLELSRNFGKDRTRDLAMIRALLLVTNRTMNRTESVLKILLKIYNDNPDVVNRYLQGVDSQPNLSDAAIWELHVVGIAHEMIATDRTLVEIPHLITALNKKQHKLIRLSAIRILSMLTPDSKQAIPTLLELLADQDQTTRLAAAIAIILIEQERSIVQEIEDRSNLDKAHLAEFHLHTEETLKNRSNLLSPKMQDQRESLFSLIEEQLASNHGFYKRQALNQIRLLGPYAARFTLEVSKATTDSNDATRKLAEQSRAAINKQE